MNRNIIPEYKNTTELNIKLLAPVTQKLSNNVFMHTLHAGSQDVVQIEWIFTAGNSYEHKNMVASATCNLLKNGTKTKTAFQINEFFEQYGAFLSQSCYNETIVVNLSCLTKHVATLLPVVVELFTESIFPQDELDLYVKNSRQTLSISLQKGDFVANRLIDKALFGGHHPYAKMSEHAYLDALTRNDLIMHYNDYIKHGRCMILVSGKCNTELANTIATHFENLLWKGIRKFHLLPNPFPKPEAIEKKHIVNDATSVQGSIRIAQPLPNRLHEDFQKLQVLNTVFGGYFGSRLMSNIREDKGYTYGIHSYLTNHIQVSSWMITTDAGKDVCEATIKEVYHEMEILRTELIDDEEMQLVRNYLMGSILGNIDGPFQIMSRWKNMMLNSVDDNYFYRSMDIIKNITPTELKELANKYLQPELFYELVVY
jgi:zinc protease